MAEPQDIKSLQEPVFAAIVSTTRSAGQISAEELPFQRSLDPRVGEALDERSARLLDLSRRLLKSASSVAGQDAPVLEELDDVDTNWRGVVDVVDSLLEKTDTCLDEYTGLIKPRPASERDQSGSVTPRRSTTTSKRPRTENLLKPQLAFDHKPDNSDASPWKPLLTSKPHAVVPLEKSLEMFTDEYQLPQYDYHKLLPLLVHDEATNRFKELGKGARKSARESNKRLAKLGETDMSNRFRHPYETEILQLEYPQAVYESADPILHQPIETTSAVFVDTFEGVLEMLKELKGASEIAVDLEHHDARTYTGLVSLMQISTREKDWIVDTLKPWRQDLQVLNEVFADPRIIKVFHGAFMDIIWLQRDLGLYVVGLFDTHHACRTLGYPGGSLAYLLKRFVDFDADKQYQLADWRIRPLPKEMFFYARADTHFLLYIYDHLRNELVTRSDRFEPSENRIEKVLQLSKETSLHRHSNISYDAESGKGPGGWYNLLQKTPSLFNSEQFAVFRAVHGWRDKVARADDDSPGFIMSTSVLLNLAKLMPADVATLFGSIHPISHSVRSRATELLEIIKEAKEKGKDGPNSMDILRPDSVGAVAKTVLEKSDGPVTTKTVMQPQEVERSEKSRFWGGAFGSSIWDGAKGIATSLFRIAMPLPSASETTAASTAKDEPPQVSQPAKAEFEADKIQLDDGDNDEAFVIKKGNKRKYAVEDPVAANTPAAGQGAEDEIPLSAEEAEKAARKAARKAEKKAEKKAKRAAEKAAQEAADKAAVAAAYDIAGTVTYPPNNESGENDVEMGEGAAEGDEEEEEDFDYAKAASVLYSKGKGDDKRESKKQKKEFDPYSKSADAPKGMRKLQGEKAGKSHTFKK